MPKYTNSLIHETSPYLLQHAHNPVKWYAWKPEVLEKAKQEDKLVLVSIGYSACHWCHVMEHECFENEEVAELMNKHFINIKIDREERPDIDMVYMTAVQMMTGQGGWPLNCFILPDGRPIYSGTYFPKEQWVNVLNSLVQLHTTNRKKVEEYANELTQGMQQAELFTISKNSDEISLDSLHKSVSKWKSKLDTLEGGPNRAPKFPLPNNYRFLLEYYTATKDEALLSHIQLTLRKMAWGGIYDQLGGGFARYSTDIYWKVPHFEKMLYDNAQLVTLYCEAYQSEKNELYKQVVYETLDFIRKELTSPEGGFYSALDADTEGEEGKYYVWKKEELEGILENDFPVFSDYYSINDVGYWEHGNYVLMRSKSTSEIALAHQLSIPQLQSVISNCKTKLLTVRNTRTKPGLDDKIITSWNALICKAFADAWLVFQEDWMKEYALKSAQFITEKLWDKNGHLWHTYKNNQATINGFLDDYAFTIEAFMSVHLLTQDEHWLQKAKQLCDYTLEHFYANDTGIFYYTNKLDDQLIVRKVELSDNVIPASTSQMALNLHRLARVFSDSNYTTISEQLLSKVTDEFIHYGSGYSNWGRLLLDMTTPFYDIVIIGKQAEEKIKEIHTYYLPNTLILASKQASDLSVFKDRYVSGKTLLYVCKNNTCSLPVETVKEAINQLVLETSPL